MRALLINPGHDNEHSATDKAVHRDPPPMSILSVGTALKQKGEEVDILDTHISEDWRADLAGMLEMNGYDWVGITVIIGNHMRNADEITQYIRKYWPKLPVKWGGTMCSVMPDEIRAAYGPDELHVGHLGDFTAIDWTLLGDKVNKEQKPYYQMVMSARGCPFSCSFCYQQAMPGGEPIVYRSAEDVCAELDGLYNNYGINVFTFGDDNLLTKPSRAVAILEHCRKSGYYIEEAIGHINNLTDEVIGAMAGVVGKFIFSIESADERFQQLLRKRINLNAVPDKLNRLSKVGIVSNVSFMVGLPGETDEDLRANWAYMGTLKEANKYIRGNAYLWFPLPQTELTNYAEEKYGVNLHFPVRDYEGANFWMKEWDNWEGNRYRPYLSADRYRFLFHWGQAFNDTFAMPDRPGGGRWYVLDEVAEERKPDWLGRPLADYAMGREVSIDNGGDGLAGTRTDEAPT